MRTLFGNLPLSTAWQQYTCVVCGHTIHVGQYHHYKQGQRTCVVCITSQLFNLTTHDHTALNYSYCQQQYRKLRKLEHYIVKHADFGPLTSEDICFIARLIIKYERNHCAKCDAPIFFHGDTWYHIEGADVMKCGEAIPKGL